jgi:hypothetical protein
MMEFAGMLETRKDTLDVRFSPCSCEHTCVCVCFLSSEDPWNGGVTVIEYPSPNATAWCKRQPKGARGHV